MVSGSRMLSDNVGSDGFRQSDPVIGIRRYPTISDCRKALEVIEYHRFPTVGILSDPTVGFCRILSDPIGSDGVVSTWVVVDLGFWKEK